MWTNTQERGPAESLCYRTRTHMGSFALLSTERRGALSCSPQPGSFCHTRDPLMALSVPLSPPSPATPCSYTDPFSSPPESFLSLSESFLSFLDLFPSPPSPARRPPPQRPLSHSASCRSRAAPPPLGSAPAWPRNVGDWCRARPVAPVGAGAGRPRDAGSREGPGAVRGGSRDCGGAAGRDPCGSRRAAPAP